MGFGTLLTVAALLAGLALFGCSAEVNVGGGSEASGEELAGEIEDDYAERSGVGLRGLTCEGVEGDVGETFSCTGRNERSVQLEIGGEVTDATGSGFDYTWQVTGAVAPGVLFERALREQIEAGGVALSEVRCPVEVEIEVGATVDCEAADRNGVGKDVTLRLTDLDGGFDFRVEGEAPAAGAAAAS